MIMPFDQDYQQTKRLKKSNNSPPSPFRELAVWITSRYEVEVLNIHYDTIMPDDRPRLNVILEWMHDERKFHTGFNYDEAKQQAIKEKFKSLLAEQRSGDRFKTNGLLVVFSAFETVARIEANEKVTEDDLEHLKQRLDNPDLWTISRLFGGATFFFYTDTQAKTYESKGLRQQYSEEYTRLVAPHDEFGYLARSGIHVSFDSKENLDNNYQSNWYYYYK